MIAPEQLKEVLQKGFPDGQIEVVDLTGTRDHYSVTVVSAAFQGKSLIQQQRMVYAALGDLMKAQVHALALTTRAPA